MTDNLPIPIADIERMASAIAKSGLFGMKTPEQALALMLIAHAEGRHPALAARDYDIIQGRPAKKAEAMLRDFLSAGGRVEWHAMTDTEASATFAHPAGGSVRIDWDVKRATAAGLAGKATWKQYPRQMLRSRVVSEGVRAIYPLATSGMYVPEEIRDIDARPMRDVTPKAAVNPETGEIIESPPSPISGDAGHGKAPSPPVTPGVASSAAMAGDAPALDLEWQERADDIKSLLESAKSPEQFREFWDKAAAGDRAEIQQHAPDVYRDLVARMRQLATVYTQPSTILGA